MNDENKIDNGDDNEATKEKEALFLNAFFAALTGVAGRGPGQDAGAVANEAHTLAERAVERYLTGRPVLHEAERAKLATEMGNVSKGGTQPAGNVVATGATVTGGHFQRPGASTP